MSLLSVFPCIVLKYYKQTNREEIQLLLRLCGPQGLKHLLWSFIVLQEGKSKVVCVMMAR